MHRLAQRERLPMQKLMPACFRLRSICWHYSRQTKVIIIVVKGPRIFFKENIASFVLGLSTDAFKVLFAWRSSPKVEDGSWPQIHTCCSGSEIQGKFWNQLLVFGLLYRLFSRAVYKESLVIYLSVVATSLWRNYYHFQT